MGIITLENEVATAIPAAKVFKVSVLEADTIIPKILPQATIEIIEGNGGPGTIKKTTSAEGYVNHKIEAIDEENMTYSYTAIGGNPWLESLDKAYCEFKISSSGDGGSIIKSTSKYYPKDNAVLNEDQIKARHQKFIGIFKVVEDYLLANPHDFN